MKLKTHNLGFTLLEVLLIIAIIAILTAVVIVAINPGRQLAQARNSGRTSDLRSIYSAVNQYYIDNKEWPTTIPETLTEICDTGSAPDSSGIDCTDLVDLSILVPTYISAVPADPNNGIAFNSFLKTAHAQAVGTGYFIALNGSSQSLSLTAPSSTEYDLPLVRIGDGNIAGPNLITGNVYTAGDRSGNLTTRKYNSDGVLDWSVDHGALVYAIAIDSDENVVTVGSRVGNVTTRKYNSDGVLQWNLDHGNSVTAIKLFP